MPEYIERRTALEIIDNYAKTVSEDGLVVVNAIKDIVNIICPTADVVEVVRCKDCVYAKQVKPFDDIFKCTYLEPNTRMFDIDYCRYGKRKCRND